MHSSSSGAHVDRRQRHHVVDTVAGQFRLHRGRCHGWRNMPPLTSDNEDHHERSVNGPLSTPPPGGRPARRESRGSHAQSTGRSRALINQRSVQRSEVELGVGVGKLMEPSSER